MFTRQIGRGSPIANNGRRVRGLPLYNGKFTKTQRTRGRTIKIFRLFPIYRSSIVKGHIRPMVSDFTVRTRLLHRGKGGGNHKTNHRTTLSLGTIVTRQGTKGGAVLLLRIRPLRNTIMFLSSAQRHRRIVIRLPTNQNRICRGRNRRRRSFVPTLWVFRGNLYIITMHCGIK